MIISGSFGDQMLGRRYTTFILGIVGLTASSECEAASAKSLGQPISSYSASLFGKTSLTAAQKQTLACDPDEPLGGSTSATFDPAIVNVIDFGFGPGYLRAADAPFATGFGIEVAGQLTPTGLALIDLGDYLAMPGEFTPTGYLRAFFTISGEGVAQTGKLTDQFGFNETHIPLATDGPLGVDTHYFDFEYKGLDNSVEAVYSVFADTSTSRYAVQSPGSAIYSVLLSDYVITQDAPSVKTRPGDVFPGGIIEFGSATVAGTTANVVPLPAAVWGGIVLLGGMGGARLFRRRHHQVADL
jgi:hypothetical protein